MSEIDYSIEKLIIQFSKNATEFLEDRKQMSEKVAKGEIEHCHWMDEKFCISSALLSICQSIKKLEEECQK